MACFLMAWELGAGLGHLVPLAQVAEPLVARGHEVHFVLRDLSSARGALGALAHAPRVRLWQAPVWLPLLNGQAPAVSYPELLHRAGYLDPARLGGLVQAWRSLFESIRPDLLLADHAPTALLASRGQSMRRATFGTGFYQPPAVQPMPSFREAEHIDPRRLAQTEAHTLATCNTVLATDGLPALAALHEATDVDENFLLTWPELDHYSAGPLGRAGGRYWGPLPAREQGLPAVWPDGDGQTLFAYLKADYKPIETVLQQLAKAPCRTLAHVPGLPAARRQHLSTARLRFADGAVAMGSAMAQADAVLCNAGGGTVTTALQAGRPVLMLPMQAEQMMVSRRVAASGAGAMLVESEVGTKLRSALTRLFNDEGWRDRARALAAQHATSRYGNVVGRVAERCEALAGQGV